MAPQLINTSFLFPPTPGPRALIWKFYSKAELMSVIARTKSKSPKVYEDMNRLHLFLKLRQRINKQNSRRSVPLDKLPPELRKMVYDYVFDCGTATTFQPTPALARASPEARSHYFDNTVFCLSTNRGDQSRSKSSRSALKSTTVHEDSKKLIRYFDETQTTSRVKKLVITRDARYRKRNKHIFYAWLVTFTNGWVGAKIHPLDEFQEADGGKDAGFVLAKERSKTDWSTAPDLAMVFVGLVADGKVNISADVLRKITRFMARVCHPKEDDRKAE